MFGEAKEPQRIPVICWTPHLASLQLRLQYAGSPRLLQLHLQYAGSPRFLQLHLQYALRPSDKARAHRSFGRRLALSWRLA